MSIVSGTHRGFAVGLGSVVIDGSRGLGAEVAGFGVELQRGDAVGAVHAGKLHPVLDALDAVGFH